MGKGKDKKNGPHVNKYANKTNGPKKPSNSPRPYHMSGGSIGLGTPTVSSTSSVKKSEPTRPIGNTRREPVKTASSATTRQTVNGHTTSYKQSGTAHFKGNQSYSSSKPSGRMNNNKTVAPPKEPEYIRITQIKTFIANDPIVVQDTVNGWLKDKFLEDKRFSTLDIKISEHNGQTLAMVTYSISIRNAK